MHFVFQLVLILDILFVKIIDNSGEYFQQIPAIGYVQYAIQVNIFEIVQQRREYQPGAVLKFQLLILDKQCLDYLSLTWHCGHFHLFSICFSLHLGHMLSGNHFVELFKDIIFYLIHIFIIVLILI